jgi:hypothetical protein
MAYKQQHEDTPAPALSWSTLLDEYEATALDYGSALETVDLSNFRSLVRLNGRSEELRSEITNRVNRAELAFPGSLAILEGNPL